MFIKKYVHIDGSDCDGTCGKKHEAHELELRPSRSDMALIYHHLTEGADSLQAIHVLCQAEIPDSEVTEYFKLVTLLAATARLGLDKLYHKDLKGARELLREGIGKAVLSAEKLAC